MKKFKSVFSLLLIAILIFICPIRVLANSSWFWISETRPYDVLPFVIVLTLSIEILSIYFTSSIKHISRIIFFVVIANVFSFAAPYLYIYIIPSLYTFEQTLEHTPFYIVGIVYLLITLIVEIPVVYFALRKLSTKTKKLFFTIVGTNIFTTILTGIIERVICRGSW